MVKGVPLGKQMPSAACGSTFDSGSRYSKILCPECEADVIGAPPTLPYRDTCPSS